MKSITLFASAGQAAVGPIAASSISFDVTQANGFAGRLCLGVIRTNVSAAGQVVLDARPGVPSNVELPNFLSAARYPNPPTISK